jgi:predicted lipoprotein with Yx(FWY)xxD motif
VPCTTAWPPLVATGGKLVGAGGVSSKALGTVSRNGVTQVTYHGLPLYGFINDKAAHAVNGEDVAAFLGTWYLQQTNGRPAVETPTISPEVSSNGIILSSATAAGARTLYLLTTDNAQHSTCGDAGACDALWPPLLTNAKAKAATGVAGSAIGSVIRSDGTRQVTYAGHPVYFFALDLAAGATAGLTNGEHIEDPAPVNGVWYAVSPLGNPLPGTATIGSEPESSTNSTSILSDTGAVNGEVGTLYAFSADTATHSDCNSECARIWPPVLTSTPAAVAAASAANGSLFGVVERIDGSFQVTYNGHPLYYFGLAFEGTSGNGVTAFGGTFNIVNVDGSIIP